MPDLHPSTIATKRFRLFDKELELRSRTATAIAASTSNNTEVGIEFAARQQIDYKAVIDGGTYTGTTHTLTVAIQVATAAAATTTGTTVASVAMPAAGGTRELYIGGTEVEQAVGTFAALSDPLYIRAQLQPSGSSTGAYTYGAFLSKAV